MMVQQGSHSFITVMENLKKKLDFSMFSMTVGTLFNKQPLAWWRPSTAASPRAKLLDSSYFCRTNSSVTTFFTSPNSSCFSLQHSDTQTSGKSRKRRCDAALKVGASTLAHLTLGELAASSACSRPNLRDAETTRVGRTSPSRCVLHRRAPPLTLLDHAPFHEDDTEDHKQEAGLWVGRTPV